MREKEREGEREKRNEAKGGEANRNKIRGSEAMEAEACSLLILWKSKYQ